MFLGCLSILHDSLVMGMGDVRLSDLLALGVEILRLKFHFYLLQEEGDQFDQSFGRGAAPIFVSSTHSVGLLWEQRISQWFPGLLVFSTHW